MRGRIGRLAAAAVMMGAAAAQDAPADASPDPLMPEEVAASAARHYPEVVAALAERRGAAADLLTARGAFDTVFSVDANTRAAGFYDGRYAEAKVERAFGPLGARAYGGYRISRGDYPIYENENFTNESGEAVVGVIFSLLRDRVIDERRFGIRDANLALRQADLELLLTRIGVQQRALLAYYAWVEAGQELEVFRDLLALAETRQVALERQVARGAAARITLTENAQNLTRRAARVASAERDVILAANALSLFYRGPSGAPIAPPVAALPEAVPLPPDVVDADMPAILTQRPDLAALRIAVERAQGRVELAENTLRPRLDVGVEAGQDFGPVGEGGETFDEGELKFGLTFEMPLGNRAARGRRALAGAELSRVEAEARFARDRIGAELRDVIAKLAAARRLVDLAALEVGQAEAMAAAEAKRFAQGASDFFLVNLREEALADARIRYATAILALNAARTTYDAAVLDQTRLGLTP